MLRWKSWVCAFCFLPSFPYTSLSSFFPFPICLLSLFLFVFYIMNNPIFYKKKFILHSLYHSSASKKKSYWAKSCLLMISDRPISSNTWLGFKILSKERLSKWGIQSIWQLQLKCLWGCRSSCQMKGVFPEKTFQFFIHWFIFVISGKILLPFWDTLDWLQYTSAER